jgi:ABC-type uncharacterized transport system involved in gliding motility auxiliary subunit
VADETPKPERVLTLRQRKLAITANLFVQIIAAITLVVMINWLTTRHYMRFDWTRAHYYRLADKTKQVLHALKEPVDVVVFIPTTEERGLAAKVLEDARNLLKEMQFVGGDKLRVENVDPDRNLVRAKQLVEKFKLDAPDAIIFVCGERHKYVRLDELIDIDVSGYGMGQGRIKAFKGEGVFLSAIQTVTEEKPPKVCFLSGHGERDPNDLDQRDGYSTLGQYIKRDNITVDRWNLMEKQALPDDAGVIVIAGPHQEFVPMELRALDDYLKKRGGRLLVMLDPNRKTGLETWLQNWNVQVDDDLIVAKGGVLLGTELLIVNAIGTDYAPHPITGRLEAINTTFRYARSVHRAAGGTAPGADQPIVTELVRTPAAFWGETDLQSERMTFDPGKDIKGPLCLAVAVEGRRPPGVELGTAQGRMVVVGTSSFVNNASLSGGNLDFFMNSLNWLLKREQLIAVSPKLPQEFRLDMTPNQASWVYMLVIVGMPLAVALIGLAVWARRRK